MSNLRMKFSLLAAATFVVPLTAEKVKADETATSFNVLIQVSETGEMEISKHVTVNAEGVLIKRGLFFDLPKSSSIVSVTRDGKPEEWHVESRDNAIRLYAGGNVPLPIGPHEYQLTYIQAAAVTYSREKAEITESLVGPWGLPIEKFEASVHLASALKPLGANLAGEASIVQDSVLTSSDEWRSISVRTERSLGPGETLGLRVDLPLDALNHLMRLTAPELEVFFRFYSLAKYCQEREQAFTEENVTSFENALKVIAENSEVPKAERDSVWARTQTDLEAESSTITSEHCSVARKQVVDLIPQAFQSLETESPF